MKRLAVILLLLFISVQCSKKETDNGIFTVDKLRSAPRNYIPKESLPEWLVTAINAGEKLHIDYPYSFLQIAKGEWNEQIVYLVRHSLSTNDISCSHIYLEAGDYIYSMRDDYISKLSTSKNWVVIYELGGVTYPTSFIEPPKPKQCSDYDFFVLCKLQDVPRIEIPLDSLPERLVAEINHYEQYYNHDSYAQIAKGEWNEQIVYLNRNSSQSFFGIIYNEVGDGIGYLLLDNVVSGIGDLSTSKNWVVIYEIGNVSYPNNLAELY